jgi:hypothetical protein
MHTNPSAETSQPVLRCCIAAHLLGLLKVSVAHSVSIREKLCGTVIPFCWNIMQSILFPAESAIHPFYRAKVSLFHLFSILP